MKAIQKELGEGEEAVMNRLNWKPASIKHA